MKLLGVFLLCYLVVHGAEGCCTSVSQCRDGLTNILEPVVSFVSRIFWPGDDRPATTTSIPFPWQTSTSKANPWFPTGSLGYYFEMANITRDLQLNNYNITQSRTLNVTSINWNSPVELNGMYAFYQLLEIAANWSACNTSANYTLFMIDLDYYPNQNPAEPRMQKLYWMVSHIRGCYVNSSSTNATVHKAYEVPMPGIKIERIVFLVYRQRHSSADASKFSSFINNNAWNLTNFLNANSGSFENLEAASFMHVRPNIYTVANSLVNQAV